MLVFFTVLLWRKKKNVYKITMQNRQMKEIILLAWKELQVSILSTGNLSFRDWILESKQFVQMHFPSLLLLQVEKGIA